MSPRVAIFCVLLWCAGVSIALQRSPQRSSTIKFSITSRRNLTGHWIAQVQLEHGAKSKEAGPWDVDVEQTVLKHEEDGIEDIIISALLIIQCTVPPNEPSARPSGPPEDYKLLPEQGYYKFHREPKSWLIARQICEDEGAHLAVINSPREAMAVTSLWVPKLFNDWRDNWSFIGMHDLHEEGQWITIFSKF
ncbi:hypothetical protein C0J52_06687 [Blattella germanica]|nr:hypothetical protein C0J52_06687 [Blattella germanica]